MVPKFAVIAKTASQMQSRWHDRWHDVLFLSKYIVVEVCRNKGVGRIMLYNTLLKHIKQ